MGTVKIGRPGVGGGVSADKGEEMPILQGLGVVLSVSSFQTRDPIRAIGV